MHVELGDHYIYPSIVSNAIHIKAFHAYPKFTLVLLKV